MRVQITSNYLFFDALCCSRTPVLMIILCFFNLAGIVTCHLKNDNVEYHSLRQLGSQQSNTVR